MSVTSSSNSLASEVVCSADNSLDIQVSQINSLQYVSDLPDIWALDFDTDNDEAMQLLMDILQLMETTSIPGLYAISIVGVNSRVLFEVKKGMNIFDVFRHTSYSTRVQTASLLKPIQIVKHFCNNCRMLPLVPGKLVQLHDPIRNGQTAQIIDTDLQTNKVLVKFYPTIDYKGLNDTGLNSQRRYEATYGKNKDLIPSQFRQDVLKTTKTEILIHGKYVQMICWDNCLFQNYYQYDWLPLKNIKYNVHFPLEVAIKFKREKSDIEMNIPNFDKEYDKSIDRKRAKRVQNAVAVDPYKAKREAEEKRKRLEKKRKEEQMKKEQQMREAEERIREMKPRPGDIVKDAYTSLIVKVDGYDKESGRMIATPVPIPISIERNSLVRAKEEEKARVKSQIGVEMDLSPHPGNYVNAEIQTGLSQSEILERSMAVQVDLIEPVKVNTNFVRLFDLRRIKDSGVVVAVAAKTYPTFVGITIENQELTLTDEEVEKKIEPPSSSIIDKHGGRLLVGDRVKTADGDSGIARTAFAGNVFIELEKGGVKWFEGKTLRSLNNAGLRKRTLIGAMILLNDGNQAVITEIDTARGCFNLKDKYDHVCQARFDMCGRTWKFSKESGY